MKYKVGDYVKIKSWEQMENEYGLDDSGNIICSCYFIGDMKEYCEGEYRVDAVMHGGWGDYYLLRGCKKYAFTDEMIERKTEEIKNEQMSCAPEAKEIIDALGDRVASVHVSDGEIVIYTDQYYKDL